MKEGVGLEPIPAQLGPSGLGEHERRALPLDPVGRDTGFHVPSCDRNAVAHCLVMKLEAALGRTLEARAPFKPQKQGAKLSALALELRLAAGCSFAHRRPRRHANASMREATACST